MPCVNRPCRHLQPKSLEERVEHAREFLESCRPPFPLVVDTFIDGWRDPFMHTFSAWPERFYVFQYHYADDTCGRWCIRWWNTPSHIEGHRIDDIRDWLDANVSRPLGIPPPLVRTTSQVLQERRRLEKLQPVFEAFDVEKRGYISKEKMEAVFESLGYLPETSSVAFQQIDIDRSGDIDLKEFEVFFRTIHPKLQQELWRQSQLPHVAEPAQPQKRRAK